MKLQMRNDKYIDIDVEDIQQDVRYFCHEFGGNIYEKMVSYYYLYNLCLRDFISLIENVLEVPFVFAKCSRAYSVISSDVVVPYQGLYGKGIKIVRPVVGDITHKAVCYYFVEDKEHEIE